jgi:hypothetical protein
MEGGEGEVWLEVDDRDAVWPVTIDRFIDPSLQGMARRK